MGPLIRIILVAAGMLAAVVIAPDAPLFGIVQGMLALALITIALATLALVELCLHPSHGAATPPSRLGVRRREQAVARDRVQAAFPGIRALRSVSK